MAENEFRITIEQTESEDEQSREHAAFYETANSTIYISLSHLPDILDDAATEQVVSELTRVGRENMFEDFLLVAALAEEAAHFVDHTRDLLPVKATARPSETNQTNIEVFGTEFSAERVNLIAEVVTKVFEVTEYTGNPPPAIVFVLGKLKTPTDEETPERRRYLDSARGGKHAEMYDYERRAREVQSKVLNWWFREKENVEFSFTFGDDTSS